MSEEVSARPRVQEYVRSVAVFLPFLSLLVVLLWLQHGSGRSWERPAPPPRPESAARVPGWSGTSELGEGIRLHLRLSPLHHEGARQRFEATALERRLALEHGEPWRLDLECEAREELVGRAEGELPLLGVRVVDQHGEALRALPPPARSDAPDTPLDPVAVLFCAPRRGLRAGEAVSLVLWGRAPEEHARVEGLGSASIDLLRRGLAREDLSGALVTIARIPSEEQETAGDPTSPDVPSRLEGGR